MRFGRLEQLRPLLPYLSLGLLFTLLSLASPWIPHGHYFLCAIIVSIYSLPLLSILWLAALIGLFLDLLGAHHFFGLYTVTYLSTTWILYRFRLFLHLDKQATMPLMACLFSIIVTSLWAVESGLVSMTIFASQCLLDAMIAGCLFEGLKFFPATKSRKT